MRSSTCRRTAPEVGALFRNPALARTFDYLAAAKDPLEAFYKGDVAAEIAKYSKAQDGLLAREDLAAFETSIEAPVSLRLGDTELFKTGFWSQGPAELQTLALMWQFDLKAIGFGTPDYCHLLVEAMKLAYADREQYYGDPAFAKVPAETLLSAEYTKMRAALIDMKRASLELRPGDAWQGAALLPEDEKLTPKDWGAGHRARRRRGREGQHGLLHAERRVDFVGRGDRAARLSALGAHDDLLPRAGAPSRTWWRRASARAPRSRPRWRSGTASPGWPSAPWAATTRGNGCCSSTCAARPSACRIPEAIEAPRLSSEHTPGFFAPHASEPNRVRIEPRFGAKVLDELRRRGHDLDVAPDWSEGFVSCAAFDEDTGLIEAGCDPRGVEVRMLSRVRNRLVKR